MAQSVDVHSVKSGSLADDTLVTVSGMVTATRINAEGQYSHMVLQLPESDPNFRGIDDSGLWVYLNNADDESLKTNPPAPGNLVTVTGQVNNFTTNGRFSTLNPTACGMGILPVPTVVSSADIATGARASALKVLLRQFRMLKSLRLSPWPVLATEWTVRPPTNLWWTDN